MGNHDGRIPGKERPVEHHVHALRGLDDGAGRGQVHAPDPVAEGTRGVDHHAAPCLELLSRFLLAHAHAFHEPLGVLEQLGDPGVVHQCRALLHGRHGEVDQEACVVELPVVIDHPTEEAVGLDRGDASDGLLFREILRLPESILAGQNVVHTHPDAVERSLPPLVVGHHEREVTDEVGCIAPQDPAFLERLHDQGNVALLQIAHAPVDQLRGTARGSLAEVALLDQEDVVPPRSRIHRHADARGSATDDDEVPTRGRGA